MNKTFAQLLHTTPLLWSPADLQLMNAFFKQHRAALELFRMDHVVKKREATRKANAKGKHDPKPASLKVKAKKAKRAKAKLLDTLDLDDLIATAKGAKA